MTLTLKKVALASVLALTLGVSAQAVVLPSGTTTTVEMKPDPGSFNTFYNFSVSPNRGSAAGSFATYFSFLIPTPAGNVPVTGGVVLNSAALYLGSFSSIAQLAGMTPLFASLANSSTSNGVTATSAYGTATLSPGNVYTLTTSGFAQPGGKFNSQIVLAAVPEPETYAMLLAGLGVMGFVARRRRKNS